MPRPSNRDLLLDTAETLVSRQGFEAVSVRAVNTAAKLNQGAAHYYFGSKEAMFEEGLRRRNWFGAYQVPRFIGAEHVPIRHRRPRPASASVHGVDHELRAQRFVRVRHLAVRPGRTQPEARDRGAAELGTSVRGPRLRAQWHHAHRLNIPPGCPAQRRRPVVRISDTS